MTEEERTMTEESLRKKAGLDRLKEIGQRHGFVLFASHAYEDGDPESFDFESAEIFIESCEYFDELGEADE